MRKLALIFITMLGIAHMIYSQVPDSFNYQSVVRNSEGEPVINTNINFQLSILEGSSEGTTVFTETQVVKSNSFGVCNLKVGSGADASGSLADLDWGNNKYYLNIAVDITGATSFKDMGTVELLSVPYALYAKNAGEIDKDVLYFPESDTLFAVKDRDGNIVFAVFPDGAKVYVNEGVKGTVGGFAVTGRNPGKAALEEEYLRVTPDSTRVWVNEEVKGKVGGFAVTGRNPTKNTIGDYLIVTGDSTRIYVVDTANTKGKVGGFAVTGRNPTKKGDARLMNITRENYFIGHEAGVSNTTGLYNTFFGFKSGYSNTEGHRNIFIGRQSGFLNTKGSSNVMIGDSAGYDNTTGYTNVFLGNNTGQKNTVGYQNVALGNWAGYNNTTGYRNIFVGTQAGYKNTEGLINIFIGNLTGFSNTTGSHNVYLGNWAGVNSDTASLNVFIGNSAGYNNLGGHENVFIGNTTGHNNTIGYGNTMIGGVAGYNNTEGNHNTFIGIYSGNENSTGSANVFVGDGAGSKNISGSENVYLGTSAGNDALHGSNNVFIGSNAGWNEQNSNRLYIENSSADSSEALIYGEFDNEFLRLNADLAIRGKLYFTNDQDNLMIGHHTGLSITSGNENTMIGNTTGGSTSEGSGNTFLGMYSGNENTTGNKNVFVGNASGHGCNSGSDNIAIGTGAGHWVADGNKNIFIGFEAGYFEDGSNRLYIENSGADSTNALIWGNFQDDILGFSASVGIGTIAPSERFEVVNGNIRVTNGNFIDDGTNLEVPDYVFEPDYKLESIEEHAELMWRNKHLPALKSANAIKSANGYNISERREQMLEELEKAHIYIEQLNNQIKELKLINKELLERLEKIETKLVED